MGIMKYSCNMKLVFASNNAHKLEEVRRILSPITVISMEEAGCVADIIEDGNTLEANSHIKADFLWNWLNENNTSNQYDGVIADDTGLEITVLNGAPGVYTARWAGEPACDANNRAKALRELHGKINRDAQFRTVITLITKSHGEEQMSGIVRGIIHTEEKGGNGFGYDQLFIPEGYEKTFAELPAEIKNKISHRARALTALKNKLKQR